MKEKWSNKDVSFLEENYSTHGIDYCASSLNRSRCAIIKKTKLLGLKYGGVKFKYSKENLEKVVQLSSNISDVLRHLNLRAAGGNHGVIKKYIEKYNLDVSHFKYAWEDNFQKGRNKIELSAILVENSSYGRSALKKRLYDEGLKIRQCEICGQGEIWNGMQMSLILDHKNGIHNDNRLVNLRIVCPNCASTFDTHCGKNKMQYNTV